ncbi:MAG: hypothetical protein QOF00_2822 [Pseudonocardiales bacterium]|jgi:hypothetical protein|nr:hypothetical protein [Pseudonocardiales bacterium]
MNTTLAHVPRQLPDPEATLGLDDARLLPDGAFLKDWDVIILGQDVKERLIRQAAASVRIRSAIAFTEVPLHGSYS